MAVFEYTALNARGRRTKGVIDAESERSARQKLKSRGIFPTSIEETGEKQLVRGLAPALQALGARRVSPQELGIATRQLSTLVGAGIPLVEALKALGDQLDQPRLKRVFAEVCDSVNEGSTLANALRLHPKVFPRLFVNMVASGEVSGTLDVVLERLSELMEGQAELRRKVMAAAAYPVLMLVLCFFVILILLAYVVPEITVMFEDRKASLPLPTQIVIGASEFVQSYWYLMIGGIVLAIVGFHQYTSRPAGRKRFDALKLRIWLFGPVLRKVATARFARTLGTMLASGIEVLTSLSIVKNIVGNVILEEAINSAIDGVREGQSLAAELGKANVFPKLLIHMIAIGERTGQLEPMLLRAARSYESEVDAVVSGLTKILEPLLILLIAGLVGAILASVMLPMLDLSSLAA